MKEVRIFKALWLCYKYLFIKISIEESIFDIQSMKFPPFWKSKYQDYSNCNLFDNRANVSEKSNLGVLWKHVATPLDFHLSKVLFDYFLTLKRQLWPMNFLSEGGGTKLYVLLLIKISNSCFIEAFHKSLDNACLT